MYDEDQLDIALKIIETQQKMIENLQSELYTLKVRAIESEFITDQLSLSQPNINIIEVI